MSNYYDAVFIGNSMEPVFNDTPEKTKQWLKENPSTEQRWVCRGNTMRFIPEAQYLAE